MIAPSTTARRLLLLAALLLAAGCDRQQAASDPSPLTLPPNGQGVYTDGEGTARTVLRPIGILQYGDTADGQLTADAPQALYEFTASTEDVARLEIQLAGPGAVAIYGPRSRQGLWGAPLSHTQGGGGLTLQSDPLPQGGYYLIYLLGRPGDFSLALRCAGGPCDADACPSVDACDLFCPGGHRLDEAGCRQCACDTVACDGGEGSCPLGQICVDGACQAGPQCEAECPALVDPVCGDDGRTYRNPCTAACAEQRAPTPGPCEATRCGDDLPCPSGQRCQGGQCVPAECACGDEMEPVCSAEGNTWPNLCVMQCQGEPFDYRGPCVQRRCDPFAEADGCPSGSECFPATDVPGNLPRCLDDPQSDACVYACRARPEVQPCADTTQCPQDTVCYVGPEAEIGACVQRCQLREGPRACRGALGCADVPLSGEAEGVGACLLPCGVQGETATCFDPQICAPTASGHLFCQACQCDGAVDAPVCVDGVTYNNPCLARCAGHSDADLQAGACEGEPALCAACPTDMRPVCDDDTLYASACEARCDGATLVNAGACLGEPPPEMSCRRDEDCAPTGCDGLICAAASTDLCPDVSLEYRCFAGGGQCGCVEGRCSFERTARTDVCLRRLRERDAPDRR